MTDYPIAKKTCFRFRGYHPQQAEASIQLGGSLGGRGWARAWPPCLLMLPWSSLCCQAGKPQLTPLMPFFTMLLWQLSGQHCRRALSILVRHSGVLRGMVSEALSYLGFWKLLVTLLMVPSSQRHRATASIGLLHRMMWQASSSHLVLSTWSVASDERART